MNDEPLYFFCGAVEIIIGAYLIFSLYKRIQANTLEFMLSLISASIPIGLAFKLKVGGMTYESYDFKLEFEKAFVLGMLGAVTIFSGSLWALASARRLKLDGTWPRMGVLLVGWSVTAAVILLLMSAALVAYLKFGWFEVWILRGAPYVAVDWVGVAVCFLLGSLPFALAIWIHFKSRDAARTH